VSVGATRADAFTLDLQRAQQGAVRAERTELSGEQAARALGNAWQEATGEVPSERTLALLVAHWSHETGRGQAMLNYNFGGIKGTGPSGLHAEYKTREGFGENERRVTDRFRAYTSADEGARDYMGLLVRRYGEAVESARGEDATGFVRALKAKGYFTGDEQAYIKSVGGLMRQALAQGFDAVGAKEGAAAAAPSSNAPLAVAPRVAPENTPELFGNGALQATRAPLVRPIVPFGVESEATPNEPLLAATEPTVAMSVHALMFADECTRAALLIAARQSEAKPESKDSAI
jgi:hypothetical protein